MFELGGLFASVDTIETTPLDLLTLPREIAPGVIQTSSHGEPLTTAAEQACGLPSELSRALAEDHQARKVHAPEIADRCPSWPACDTRTDKQKLRDAVQAGERAYIEQTETVPMFHGQAAAILARIEAKVHNDRRPIYSPEPVDPDSSDARWLAMVGPFEQTVYAPGANPDPRLCRTFSFVCSCGDCAVGFHRAADALHYRDSHRAEHDAYGHTQAPADQTVIGNADPGQLF